ncbi:MAG: DUF4350 domain-containing protein [Candidatus Methanoculleus thermohydrogenotrophicum]|jgi:hypothetical protein|nr:DUF4350 domain-containing protein [Candidatus Methanoculleus thermohydrogenotrophicum]NLM81866.1 DUF4350 domain-containing protein [Candidatus Methanoculleus thermohydrogenotrophicum]
MGREAWVTFIILLLAAGAVFAHATTTIEDYSRHNIGWNGTSNLAIGEIHDLADLTPGTTLLILAPERPFTAEDVAHLRAFLDDGGEVIVAEKDGAANSLLAALGSTMRVWPGNLSSLDRDHTDPRIFRVQVTGNASIFAGITTLLVNHPAAVTGGEPLLETSPLTWDDTNGDGRVNGHETFRRAVVCAREDNLIVLGDPSLFINAMLPENPEFIKNLRNHPVLIDAHHSRTGTKNPIINTLIWIQMTPLARAAIAALAILPVAYWFGRRRE